MQLVSVPSICKICLLSFLDQRHLHVHQHLNHGAPNTVPSKNVGIFNLPIEDIYEIENFRMLPTGSVIHFSPDNLIIRTLKLQLYDEHNRPRYQTATLSDMLVFPDGMTANGPPSRRHKHLLRAFNDIITALATLADKRAATTVTGRWSIYTTSLRILEVLNT